MGLGVYGWRFGVWSLGFRVKVGGCTRWSSEVSFPQNSGGYVTEFASQKTLKIIA